MGDEKRKTLKEKPPYIITEGEKIMYSNSMDRNSFSKLSKQQLIELLLKKEIKSILKPRKSVKQSVTEYGNKIIQPPPQFRDLPVTAPPPQFRNDYKPVPAPRTKITKLDKALKNAVKSYEVGIKNQKYPLRQLNSTNKWIETYLKRILNEVKGLKLVETLKITFKNPKIKIHYTKELISTVKLKKCTNDIEIEELLKLALEQIIKTIAQWLSEGSGWVIESVDKHYLNIVKYNPMKGSSYIQLPKELRNPKKGLVNMKNKDDKCFRWCHIRHLNPQSVHPERFEKSDKAFINTLDYSNTEFPVDVKQYNKIEKQNKININVFGYEGKQPFPIYV